MELVLVIYLVGLFDNISTVSGIVLAITLIMSVVLSLYFLTEGEAPTKRLLKNISTVLIVAGLLTLFIPSKDTSYKLLAAYGAIKVVENPDVQEILGEGVDVLKLSLKRYKDSLVK